GIEDVAAGPLIAVVLHVADDDQPELGFAVAFVGAKIADLIGRVVRIETLFDATEQPTVLLEHAHQRTWLARRVVDRTPQAYGRTAFGLRKHQYRREKKARPATSASEQLHRHFHDALGARSRGTNMKRRFRQQPLKIETRGGELGDVKRFHAVA